MPSAADLTPDSRFVGLFVGPSGSGKTPAACSFISDAAIAEGHRVHVFDFDGRMRGLLGCPWVNRNVVDYKTYPPRMPGGVYNELNKDLDKLKSQIDFGQSIYDTFVVDSITNETFALLCDSIPLTHKEGKGRSIGAMMVEGPDDYRFESSGTYSLLAFFQSLPRVNIIYTAHVIDRYGKQDPSDMMSPSVVVGEKLSLRDKIAANVPGKFDHVFRFDRNSTGTQFTVQFWTDLARTVYPSMPIGKQDVTGKNFYKYLMGLVAPVAAATSTTK